MDPRELREAFAANLRRLRHARGVSQEDLAHEAGINRTLSEQAREGRELPRAGDHCQPPTVPEVRPSPRCLSFEDGPHTIVGFASQSKRPNNS